ncbi:MAG: hypothetical protein LBV18_01860, partial [Alistipes sp.]|nr:hypothetical protein [Alistipes sp.]
MDERHPRDIYADFGEVVRFVRWIIGGSKVLESTGRELLRHLQSSRPSVCPQPNVPTPKEGGESIVMEYSGNRFTMKMSDGRYMVNATEMARPFEKRPTVWLKLTE